MGRSRAIPHQMDWISSSHPHSTRGRHGIVFVVPRVRIFCVLAWWWCRRPRGVAIDRYRERGRSRARSMRDVDRWRCPQGHAMSTPGRPSIGAPSLRAGTMTVLSSLRCVGTPVRDGRWRVGGGASRGGVARARASAGSAEREQFRMRFVRSSSRFF